MSNRLFQGVIHQMRDAIDGVIGIVDETATIISCSDLTRIGEKSDYLAFDLGEGNDIFIRDGYTYVDCTAGGGGHSLEIAKRMGKNSRLICFDRDKNAIAAATERLKDYLD